MTARPLTGLPPVGVLVELARADLEQRLQRGETACSEDYLTKYPQLTSVSEQATYLIYAEYVALERQGKRPSPAEFLHRFPEFRDELARLFEVHAYVESTDLATNQSCLAVPLEATPRPATGRRGTDDREVPIPTDTLLQSDERFEILEELGRGATAIVYRARQRDVGRTVALKMFATRTMIEDERLARFRSEAEVIARLNHPHIVQLYELGCADGVPLLVLEYVDGGTLADRICRGAVSSHEAAQLIETVARAVHVAHEQGVIHRDLKPSNILLDARGAPKIADFGLAKWLDKEGEPTRTGTLLGTPAYMSPEQAQGQRSRLGPTADVYSLGAILYELLMGRPPYQGESSMEVLLQVVSAHMEPVAPSAPSAPRDLRAICLKCLEKDPGRRYPTARELADDLGRFLRSEPVRASHPSAWRRAEKWVRRNRTIAIAGAVCAASLAMLAVGGWFAAFRLRESGARLAESLAVTSRHLLVSDLQLAGQAIENHHVEQAQQLLARHRAAANQNGRRNFVWHYLWKQTDLSERVLQSEQGQVWSLDVSPDDARVASAGANGTVLIWDLATGRKLEAILAHDGPARCVQFSPDGQRLVSVGEDGCCRVWQVATAQQLCQRKAHASPIYTVRWTPDGQRLITAGDEPTIRIWDANSLAAIGTLEAHGYTVDGCDVSPDGRYLASTGRDRVTRVWRLDTLRPVREAYCREYADCLAFAPDGSRLIAGGKKGALIEWRGEHWDIGTDWELDDQTIRDLAYSPDGSCLAVGTKERLVTVLDAHDHKILYVLAGHTGRVNAVTFAQRTPRLISGGRDGTIRIWRTNQALRGRDDLQMADVSSDYSDISPDGRWVSMSTSCGELKLMDRMGGMLHQLSLYSVAPNAKTVISSDGRFVAMAAPSLLPARLYAATGQGVASTSPSAPRRLLKGPAEPRVSWGPHGRVIWGKRTLVKSSSPAARKTLSVGYLSTGVGNQQYALDWNGDGREDVVHCDVTTGSLTVDCHGVDGAFGRQMVPVPYRQGHIRAVGDLDGDGCLDLVFRVGGESELKLLHGGYHRCWRPHPAFRLASMPQEWVVVADLNADGANDLVIAHPGTGKVSWVENEGQARMKPIRVLAEGLHAPNFLAAEDVDGDRQVDLLTVSGGRVLWLRGKGDGQFETPKPYPDLVLPGPLPHPVFPRWGIWSVRDRRLLATSTHLGITVECLAFSPSGEELATIGADRITRRWRWKTGELLEAIPSLHDEDHDLTYSPDGRVLAIAAGDEIVLWDIEQRERRAILRGHESTVQSLCFSPDGATLASGSHDLTVRTWDVRKGQPRRILVGHTERIRRVRFSDDGELLASAAKDGWVRVWDAELGQELLRLPLPNDKPTGLAFCGQDQLAALVNDPGGAIVSVWNGRSTD